VRYRFGDFELDALAYTLTRAGLPIVLQPKVFDVVRHLIEHRDRLVTKDELLDSLWPGEHVNESAVVWSISHARRALGQDRAQKQPIETVHGRGYRFTSPVELFGPSSGAPPASPIAPSSERAPSPRPFVGRVEVMLRLKERLSDAKRGKGQLCVLSGEPGIGKSRCAQELLALARNEGASAWTGRAAEGVGAPVFWPWIQILREALRERVDLRAACEPVLSHLTALDADSPAPRATIAARTPGDRFWLLDAIWRLLREAAEQKPVVILIDDLQWADAESMRLMRFVAPELANSRVLILATQREEANAQQSTELVWLARHAERIELARLTADDVASYLADVTGTNDLPKSLALAVHRATAGNPLFVQEIVRALLADGGHDGLRSIDPAQVKPPQAARDVLRSQLDALGAETRTLLSQASILGESFELSLLAKVAGTDPDRLLGLLELATKHDFTLAETPDRYRFSHGLLRSLLYEETQAEERVNVHRRAAELLSELDSTEPRYSEIAYHYYRSLPAGAYDRVCAAARRAATAAEAVSAFEDAVRFYGWALEAQALDSGVKPRARAELLLACGTAQRAAGRDVDAYATIYRMFELAHQHGYADLLLLGTRVVRPTHLMSPMPNPKVRAALDEVLRLSPEGANEQRISALSQLACIPPNSLDMQRSKELSGQALELARARGTDKPTLEALRARLYSLSGPDDIDALLQAADEILQIERTRPTWISNEAYSARFGALLYRGDMAEADSALAAYGRIAQQSKRPEPIWYHDRIVAQRRLLDGDFAGAEAACRELRARSDRMGLSYGAWFTDIQLNRIAIERQGAEVVAASWNFLALAAAPSAQQLGLRPYWVRGAAEFGAKDQARAALAAIAASDFEDIPKELSYLDTLANLAVAAVALEDQIRAENLYAKLAPYPQHNTPNTLLFYQGSVSHYLALLAVMLGREAKAEQHFEDALAMNERTGQRPQLARTRYHYARWLGQRGVQAARVRELADGARQIGEELGMKWMVARVAAL
jgi:DNA-binding winged helix-turn-helix (wHTH) protein